MAYNEITPQADRAEPSSDAAWRADFRELEAIAGQVRRLVEAGATSRKASTDQKFEMGDLIRNLQNLQIRIDQRAALPGATADDTQLRERFRVLDKELFKGPVKGQALSRPTIINFGRVAAAFPGDHPIRSRLSFSFAKTLASLETQTERDEMYEETLLRSLSVKALQEELSSRRGPDSAVVSVRKQSKAFVCAGTKNPITILSVMVELRFVTASPPSRSQIESRSRRNRAAAARSAPKAGGQSSPKTLRFQDAAALLAWLTAHQSDFPAVNKSPAASESAASEPSVEPSV